MFAKEGQSHDKRARERFMRHNQSDAIGFTWYIWSLDQLLSTLGYLYHNKAVAG